ncbi:hypothetical protein MKUB_52360 [Mycobacterium kubicae]|uniref:Dinitrogenase iron-molybdenum cofactor biosynthesis domain-containing protein n=1 Tax=Mycobacterium kubicae TaxID=120959 RepID=A0ABQ1BVQ5_9MYCO|nr:hypothetical protein MKUB_52360 [Mycobacterium kubicae]
MTAICRITLVGNSGDSITSHFGNEADTFLVQIQIPIEGLAGRRCQAPQHDVIAPFPGRVER